MAKKPKAPTSYELLGQRIQRVINRRGRAVG